MVTCNIFTPRLLQCTLHRGAGPCPSEKGSEEYPAHIYCRHGLLPLVSPSPVPSQTPVYAQSAPPAKKDKADHEGKGKNKI